MQFIKLKKVLINKTSLFPIKNNKKKETKKKTKDFNSITNNEPIIKNLFLKQIVQTKKKSQNRQITKKHVYYTLYYAINKIIYIFLKVFFFHIILTTNVQVTKDFNRR